MSNQEIRNTLLVEIHGAIDAAAQEAVAKLGGEVPYIAPTERTSFDDNVASYAASLVHYPPMESTRTPLSPGEHEALSNMALTADGRSGLKKLIADATANAFYRFFCLVDGVGDPEVQFVEGWLGAAIRERASDSDEGMLHDEFFESYQNYRKLRGNSE